jgi:hypothetical protein
MFTEVKSDWRAADIEMKRQNGWMIFYDRKTMEVLNHPKQDRPLSTRASYQHKDAPAPPESLEISPLDRPPVNNYTAFKVRKPVFTAPEAIVSVRRIDYPGYIDPPQKFSDKFSKGKDLRRNPFRRSHILANEEAFTAVKREVKPEGVQKRPKRVKKLSKRRKIGKRNSKGKERSPQKHVCFSLYERSLKPKEGVIKYEWPEDFYQFQLSDDD